MAIEKATKHQLLSQVALLGMFTFIIVTFIMPAINANSEVIKVNSQGIEDLRLLFAEMSIEKLGEKLDVMDVKIDRIVLGFCGEFGGKYCE